jgi:hypothetical protein
MTPQKRIIVIVAQLAAATLAGYLAAFLTVMAFIWASFAVGLIAAALIGGLVVAGVGRAFGMRGQWWMPIIAAGIGAAIGFAVLQLPVAVANMPLWFALMLIPGILAVAAYHWSDSRAT